MESPLQLQFHTMMQCSFQITDLRVIFFRSEIFHSMNFPLESQILYRGNKWILFHSQENFPFILSSPTPVSLSFCVFSLASHFVVSSLHATREAYRHTLGNSLL